jgi:hypothetical protein
MSSDGSYCPINMSTSCEPSNDQELVYAVLDSAFYDHQNMPLSVSENSQMEEINKQLIIC